MKRTLTVSLMAFALSFSIGYAAAAEQQREQVYGNQLMTQQERDEYRARMRAANSVQEQEQIRKEHHERMKERAKTQGGTLPKEPPARGGGMGPGGARGN